MPSQPTNPDFFQNFICLFSKDWKLEFFEKQKTVTLLLILILVKKLPSSKGKRKKNRGKN